MADAFPTNFPDVLCDATGDLDLYARECPNDYVGLQQDVLHLENQAAGSNLDDATKGVDVPAMLSGTLGALQAGAAELEEQLHQDDRIEAASVNVIQNTAGTPAAATSPYTLDVQIQPGASVLPPGTVTG